MAIKISGTVVIDDNRNLCNVGNLNASSLNVGVSGTYLCGIACTDISEGSPVVQQYACCCGCCNQGFCAAVTDPPTVIEPFAVFCNVNNQAHQTASAVIPVKFPCAECGGCFATLTFKGGKCCGCCYNNCCWNQDAYVDITSFCVGPSGTGYIETPICCIVHSMTQSWPQCYCNASIGFCSMPMVVCHPNGSTASVIFHYYCQGDGVSCFCGLREITLCYCTATCTISLLCDCCAQWSSAFGRGSNYMVTPDNCYVVYFYANLNCQANCNNAIFGAIVHRNNGSDCLIEVTRATEVGCSMCCVFQDPLITSQCVFAVQRVNSQGFFPFTYGTNGWILGDFNFMCYPSQPSWYFAQKLIAVKPNGNNSICVGTPCCAACLRQNYKWMRHWCCCWNSGGICCYLSNNCCGHLMGCEEDRSSAARSIAFDEGNGIKKVVMDWPCDGCGCYYFRFNIRTYQRVACFCVCNNGSICHLGGQNVTDCNNCDCNCCWHKCFGHINVFRGTQSNCSCAIANDGRSFSANDINVFAPGHIDLYRQSIPICPECAKYRTAASYGLLFGTDCSCGGELTCNCMWAYYYQCCCACQLGSCYCFACRPHIFDFQFCVCTTCWDISCNFGVVAVDHSTAQGIFATEGSCYCWCQDRRVMFATHHNCSTHSAIVSKTCGCGQVIYYDTQDYSRCNFAMHSTADDLTAEFSNYDKFVGIAQNGVSAGETVKVATIGMVDRSSFSCYYFQTDTASPFIGQINCHGFYNGSALWCAWNGGGCISGITNNALNYRFPLPNPRGGGLHFYPFYDQYTGRVVSLLSYHGSCCQS